MQAIVERTLSEEINGHYHAAREHFETARNEIIEGSNELRNCGILIGNNRNQLELDFGEREAQECIRIARHNPDPITNIQQALLRLPESFMTTALLPFPDGHGPQQLHEPNFFSFTSKHLVAWRTKWQREINRVPLEQWELPTVQQFVQQLEPIHQIYEAAKARLNGS